MIFRRRAHPRTPFAVILTALLCVVIVLPAFSEGSSGLLERINSSVAFVVAKSDRETRDGAAFVAHPDGLLITTLHVLDEASEVYVHLPNGHSERAAVVGVDVDNDLALLQVPKTNLPPLTLRDSYVLILGGDVIVAGYRRGSHDLTLTSGRIGAFPAQTELIPIDASMDPGDSGGPVLDAEGAVIGIAVSRLNPSGQNENFVSPVSKAISLLENWQSEPNRSPLALPLTTGKSLAIDYTSGGIGVGGNRQELGISCIEPPPHATALSGVHGEIGSIISLVEVETWLSVRSGAARNAPISFAHLRHVGQYTRSRNPSSQWSVNASDLGLVPSRICLNYDARVLFHPLGIIFGSGYTFHVTYTVNYRVLSADRIK